ncbi:FAR-17a/AIG1-like protein [Kalmanozyma brasiliensis GHG001]|uniref:Integral membrane protein n=1 Tax=Kalmanozyma brasiliensis (strain GHG001) TaxID=1365824 RepID=V5GU52_KALBG|nr:FAR-17a/AIG1-like protein [Kalmanozyma brasiliensis GHG001]EST09437.1 FAR-17a/AIG1-like protein [Kalmanozyma brasiliensis GHG001]
MALSSKQVTALAWHSIAFASCIYGFKSVHILPDLLGVSMADEYGGFMQFLTMCGLAGTTATMSLALVLDVIQGPQALLWLKDLLMAASLPTETLITVLYWSIVMIDKSLLMPPKQIMDPANPGQVLREEPVAIPFLIDASMHAFPGVWLLVDFFVFSRRLPKSIPIVPLAATVTVSYALWAEKCAKMNGHYPYPLLDILSTAPRLALYGASGVVACAVGLTVTKLQASVKGSDAANAKKRR